MESRQTDNYSMEHFSRLRLWAELVIALVAFGLEVVRDYFSYSQTVEYIQSHHPKLHGFIRSTYAGVFALIGLMAVVALIVDRIFSRPPVTVAETAFNSLVRQRLQDFVVEGRKLMTECMRGDPSRPPVKYAVDWERRIQDYLNANLTSEMIGRFEVESRTSAHSDAVNHEEYLRRRIDDRVKILIGFLKEMK